MTDQIQIPLLGGKIGDSVEKIIEITNENTYQIEDYLTGNFSVYVLGQDVLVVPQDGSERIRFVNVVDLLVNEELLLLDAEGNPIVDATLIDQGESAVEVLDSNGLGLSLSGLGIGDGLGYSGLLGYGSLGLGGSAGLNPFDRGAGDFGAPITFANDTFTYKLVSIGRPHSSSNARARSVVEGGGENGEVYENQQFGLKIEGIADALNSVAPSSSFVYLNLYLKPTSDASPKDFDFSTLAAGSPLPMDGEGMAWLHSYNPDTGVIIIQTLGWKDGSAAYIDLWTSADSLVEVNEKFEFGLEVNQQMTGTIIDDGAANLIAMESQTGTIIDQLYQEPWQPGDPGDPTDPTNPGKPGKPTDPVDPTNPKTGNTIGFALRPMDTSTKDQYNYTDADGNLRYPGLQIEEGGNLVLSIATGGANLGSHPIYLELNMYLGGGLVLGGNYDKKTPDADVNDINWVGIKSTTPGVEVYTDGNGKIIIKVPAGFETGRDINIVIPTLADDIIEALEDIRFDLTEGAFTGTINDVIRGDSVSLETNSDLDDNIVFQVNQGGETINNKHAEGQIADDSTDPEGPDPKDPDGKDDKALRINLEPIEADHKTLTNIASEDGEYSAEFGIRIVEGTLAENAKLGLSLVLRPSAAHKHKADVEDYNASGIKLTMSDGTVLKIVPQSQFNASIHDGYYFVNGDSLQINFSVSGAAADEIILSVPAQKDNVIEPAEYFQVDLLHWDGGSDSGLKSSDSSVVVTDSDATGAIVDHWDQNMQDSFDYEIDINPSEVKENNEVTITITGKGTDKDGDGTHANAPDDIPIFIDVSLAKPGAGNGFATPDDFDWSNIKEGDSLPVYDKNGNIVDDAKAWVESVNPDTGEITIGTQGWDHDNYTNLDLIALDDNKIEQDEDFTFDVGINDELTDDEIEERVTAEDEATGTVVDDGKGGPGEGDRVEFTLKPLSEDDDVHLYDGVQIEENDQGKIDNVIILSVSSKGLDTRGNEVDGMELGSSTFLLFEMLDPSDEKGRANADDIDWKNASVRDADGNIIKGANIYADGNGKVVVELPVGFDVGEDFQVHLPAAYDNKVEGMEHFEFGLVETIDMPSFNDVISNKPFNGNNDSSLADNIAWGDDNDIAEGDIIDQVVDPIPPVIPPVDDGNDLVFELQPTSADDNIASEFKSENKDAIFTIKLNDGDNDHTPDTGSYGDLSANAKVGLTLVLKPSEDQKYTANMEKDIDLENITLTIKDKAGAEQRELTLVSKENYDANIHDGYYFINAEGNIQLNFAVSDMLKGWTVDVRVPAVQDNTIEVDEYFEADLSLWDEGSSDGLKAADGGVVTINNDAEAKIVDGTDEEGQPKHKDDYTYEIIEVGPKDDPTANEVDEGDSLVVVIEGKGTDRDEDGIHSDAPEDIPVYIDIKIEDIAGGADPSDFDLSGFKPGDPIPVIRFDEDGNPVESDAKAWIEAVDPETGVITVGTENWDHKDRIELEIPVVDEVVLPGDENEGDEDFTVIVDINNELTDDAIDGGDGEDPRVGTEGEDGTGTIKDKPEDHLSFNLLPLSTATEDERQGVSGYEGTQVEEGSSITLAIGSSGVELKEGPAYLEINLTDDGKATPEDFDWTEVSASYNGEPLNVYADGNGKLVVEIPEGFKPGDSNIEINIGVKEDNQIEGLEDFTFALEDAPFTGDIEYVNGNGGTASLVTNDNAGITAKDSSTEGAIVDKVTDPVDPGTVDPKDPLDPNLPVDPTDPDGPDNLALRVELEAVTADHKTETNVASEADQQVKSSFFINFTNGNLAAGSNLGLSLVLSPVYEKVDAKGNLLEGQHAAEVAQDIDYAGITLVLILADGSVKQITGKDLNISINSDGNIQINFKVSGVPEGSKIRVDVPAAHDNEIEVAEYFKAELSHWSAGSDLGLKAIDGAVDVVSNNATGVIVDTSDEDNGGNGSYTEDSYKFEIVEVGVDSDPSTGKVELNEGDNLVIVIEGKGTDNDGDGINASSPSDVPIYIDVSIADVAGGADPSDFDLSGFKPGDPITVTDKNGNPVDSEAWVEAVDPETGTITIGAKDWDHENRIELEVPVLKDGEIEEPEDGKVTVDVNDELTDDDLDGGDNPRIDITDGGGEAEFEIIDGSDKETIDFVLRSIVDTDTHYYEGTQIEETKSITLYVGTSAHKNITQTGELIYLEINMINPSSAAGKANLDDIDWTGVTASFNGAPLNIYATAEGKLILEIPADFNPRLGAALGEDIQIHIPTLDNNDGVVEGLEEFIFEMVEQPFTGDVIYVNNGGGSASLATGEEIASKVDYTLTDNGDIDTSRGTTNEQAIGEIIDIITSPTKPDPTDPGDPDGPDDKAVRLELEAVNGNDNIAYEAVNGNKTDDDHASFTIKLSSDSDGELASNATLGLRLTLKPLATNGRNAAEMGTSAADSDIDVANIKIVLADGTVLKQGDFVLKFIDINGEQRIQIDFKLTGGIKEGQAIKVYVPALQDGQIEAAEYFEVDLAHWSEGSDDGLKKEDSSVVVTDAIAEGKIVDHEDPSKLDEFDYIVDSISPTDVDEGDEITVRITGDGKDNDGDGIANAPDDIPVYIDVNFVDKDKDVTADDFDFTGLNEGDPLVVYDKDGNVNEDSKAWIESIDPETGEITIGTQGWDDGDYVDLTVKTNDDGILENNEDFTVTTDINTELTDDAIDGKDKDGNPVDMNDDGVIDEHDKPRVDATGEGDGTIIEGDSGVKFGLSLDSSTVDASNNYGGTQVEERPDPNDTSLSATAANNIVLNLSSTVDPILSPDGVTADKPVYLVIKMDTDAGDLVLGGDYSNKNDASIDDIDWSDVTVAGIPGAKVYADGNGTLVIELPAGYVFGGDDLKINIPVKYDTSAEALEDFRFELQDSLDNIPSFKDVITGGNFNASNSIGGIGFEDEAGRQADGQIIDNNDKGLNGGLKVELVPVDADADENIAYELGDGVDDEATFEIRLASDTEYTLADNADLGLSLILKPSGTHAAEMGTSAADSDIDVANIKIVLADGTVLGKDDFNLTFVNGNIQIDFTVTGGLDKGQTIKVYIPALHDNQIEAAEYFEVDLVHWDAGSDEGLKSTDGTVTVSDADATGKIIDHEDSSKLDIFDYTVESVSPTDVEEGDEITVRITGEGTDKDGDGIHANAPDDIPVFIDVNFVGENDDVSPEDFDFSGLNPGDPLVVYDKDGNVNEDAKAWVESVDPDTGKVTIGTEGWDHDNYVDLTVKAESDSILEDDEDFTVTTDINTELTDDAIDGIDENGNPVDANGDGVIDEGDKPRVDATGESEGTIVDNSSGIDFHLKLDDSTVDGNSTYNGKQVEEQTNIVLNLSSTLDTSLIAAGATASAPVYLVIQMDTATTDLILGNGYSNESDASLADIDWSQVTISGVDGAKIYADGNGKLVVELPAGYQFDGGSSLKINLPVLEDNMAEGLEDFRFELQDYTTDPISGFTNVINGGDDFAGNSNSLGGIGTGSTQADGQLIDNNDNGPGLKVELVAVDGDNNVAKEGNITDNMSEFTIKLASDSKYTLADNAGLGLSLILKPIAQVDADLDGNIDRWSAEMGTNAANSDIDVANIVITLANGDKLTYGNGFTVEFVGGNIKINFTVEGGLGRTDEIKVSIPAKEDYQLEAQEYFQVDLEHWDGGSDNGLKSGDGTVEVVDADATGKIVDADESLMFQFEVIEAKATDDVSTTTDKVEVKEGTNFIFTIKGQSVDKDGNLLTTGHDAPEDIPLYIKVSLADLGLSEAEAADFNWSSVSINYSGSGSASIDSYDAANGVIIIKTLGWDHGDTATISLPVKKEQNETAIEGNEGFVLTPEVDGKTDDAFENRVDISGNANADGVDGDGNITGEIIDVSDAKFKLAFNNLHDVLLKDSSGNYTISQDQRPYESSAFYGGIDIEESEDPNTPSSVILGINASGVTPNKDVYVKLSLRASSQSGSADLKDFDWTSVKLDNMPSGFEIYANNNGEMILKIPAGFDPTSSGTQIRISIDIANDDIVENREEFFFGMDGQYNGNFAYINNGGGSMTTSDQLDSSYLDVNTGKLANGTIMDKVTDAHVPTPVDKHKPVDPSNTAGDDGLALYISMEDIPDTATHTAQYAITLEDKSAGHLADNAALGLSLTVLGIAGFNLGSSTSNSAIDLGNIQIIVNGKILNLVNGNSFNSNTGSIPPSSQGQYYFVQDGVLRIDFKVLDGWTKGDTIEVRIPLKNGSVVAADNIQVSLDHWSQGSWDVTGAGDTGGLYGSDDAVVIEQSGAPTGGGTTILDGIKEFENQTIFGRPLADGANVSSGTASNPNTFAIIDGDLNNASSGEVVTVTGVKVITDGLPVFMIADQSQSLDANGAGVIYGKYGILTIYDGKKEAGDTDAGGEYSYKLYTEADRAAVKSALGLTDAQFDALLSAIEALEADEVVEDVFTYTLTDKDGLTGVGTIKVKIEGENDAPILTGDQDFTKDDVSSYAGTEANGVLVIPDGSKLTISDADSDKITKLVVTLTAPIGTSTAGDDLFSSLGTLPAGITLSSDTGTTLVFTAANGASFADFLSIIHSIKYQNTDFANMDKTGGRQVKFQIFNGDDTLEDTSLNFADQFDGSGNIVKPSDHNTHDNADSVWIQDIVFQGGPSSENGGFQGAVTEFINQTVKENPYDTAQQLEATKLSGSVTINDPDFASGDTVKIHSIGLTSKTVTANTIYGFSGVPITQDKLPDMSKTFNINDLSGKIYGFHGILEFSETSNLFNSGNTEASFNYRLYTWADMDDFIRACGGDPADKYSQEEGNIGRQAYVTFVTLISTIEVLNLGDKITDTFEYTLIDSTGLTSGTEKISIDVEGSVVDDVTDTFIGPAIRFDGEIDPQDGLPRDKAVDINSGTDFNGEFFMIDKDVANYQQSVTMTGTQFAVDTTNVAEVVYKSGSTTIIEDVIIARDGVTEISSSDLAQLNGSINSSFGLPLGGLYISSSGQINPSQLWYNVEFPDGSKGTGEVYGLFGKLQMTDGYFDYYEREQGTKPGVNNFDSSYGLGKYTYTAYTEADRGYLTSEGGLTDAQVTLLLDYIGSGQAKEVLSLYAYDSYLTGKNAIGQCNLTFDINPPAASPTPQQARMAEDDVDLIVGTDDNDSLTISSAGLFNVDGGEGYDLLKFVDASDLKGFDTQKKDQIIEAVIDGESVKVDIAGVERIEFEETTYEWSGREWIVES